MKATGDKSLLEVRLTGELMLPLFPLGVVLFPEELLPLHIFEERYREMIGECLQREKQAESTGEFGVVWVRGNQMQPVGCTARITQVIRRYEDGRLDILTQGQRRFEILLTNSEKAYLRGEVVFLEDDADSSVPTAAENERAQQLFVEILKRLSTSEAAAAGSQPAVVQLSFRIARTLPLALELKQQILVLRSEAERLRGLTEVMEKLIPALDFREKARAKASGNGDAHSLRKLP